MKTRLWTTPMNSNDFRYILRVMTPALTLVQFFMSFAIAVSLGFSAVMVSSWGADISLILCLCSVMFFFYGVRTLRYRS